MAVGSPKTSSSSVDTPPRHSPAKSRGAGCKNVILTVYSLAMLGPDTSMVGSFKLYVLLKMASEMLIGSLLNEFVVPPPRLRSPTNGAGDESDAVDR